MLLSRKEYDDLIVKAHKAPDDGPPAQAVLASAVLELASVVAGLHFDEFLKRHPWLSELRFLEAS